MNGHEYNWELCQQRHRDIEDDMKEVKDGLSKVSNRFIILLTLLAANLIGVAANLFFMVIQK